MMESDIQLAAFPQYVRFGILSLPIEKKRELCFDVVVLETAMFTRKFR